jgi:hypothetical protein
MEEQLCPNTPKCPIFSGILKGTEYTETYKRLYCEGGVDGRERCRRFQVSQLTGMCPPEILPNSSKTVEEIIQKMKKDGILKN